MYYAITIAINLASCGSSFDRTFAKIAMCLVMTWETHLIIWNFVNYETVFDYIWRDDKYFEKTQNIMVWMWHIRILPLYFVACGMAFVLSCMICCGATAMGKRITFMVRGGNKTAPNAGNG